jgi:hypothetical protein
VLPSLVNQKSLRDSADMDDGETARTGSAVAVGFRVAEWAGQTYRASW